jgi:poly-beta-1,6-N-acetyl-D-glucosamine synthase
MACSLTYVLITPARNEAKFIERELKSVIAQTIRPLRWVIVSDGSMDGTDEIVTRYAAGHQWIELLRMPERRERSFAGKILAFNAGWARVRDLDYQAIACLDADASFGPDHFAFLLEKLADDPRLGLVGTAFEESGQERYDYRFVSMEHVSGICQLFRRECLEDIGGYMATKDGAVDRIANIASRMKGWKTRTYTERLYFHHRRMGTAEDSLLRVRFHDGAKDYVVGSHPLWMLFRSAYQMSRRPFFLGGAMILSGYVWSAVRGVKRPITRELVQFNRREQMSRLRDFLTSGAAKSV